MKTWNGRFRCNRCEEYGFEGCRDYLRMILKKSLGTGENLLGTRAGTIDRGAETFFEKTREEDFFSTKIRGAKFARTRKYIQKI